MSETRTAAEILTHMGTDAVKWTDEFMRVQADPKSGPLDWGAMVGWFANAIEAGRSAGRRETCPHAEIITLGEDLGSCRLCGKLFEYEQGGPVNA